MIVLKIMSGAVLAVPLIQSLPQDGHNSQDDVRERADCKIAGCTDQ